jgi:hypothetical protein
VWFPADVTGDVVVKTPRRVATLMPDELRQVVQGVKRSCNGVRYGVISAIRRYSIVDGLNCAT